MTESGSAQVSFSWKNTTRIASSLSARIPTLPQVGQLIVVARSGPNQIWTVADLFSPRERVKGVIWQIDNYASGGCTLWFDIFYSEGDRATVHRNTVTLSSAQLGNWRAVGIGERRAPIQGDAVYLTGIMRHDRDKIHWRTDDWLQSPSGEAVGKRDRSRSSRSRSRGPPGKRQA